MIRYFTHVDKFGDGTAYIYFNGSEEFRRGTFVRCDGSEGPSFMRIWQALKSVRKGAWKEITEQEAKQLLKRERV